MKSATWKVASIAIAILLLLLVTLIWLEFPPAIPVQELADPGTLVAEDSGTNEASLARAEAVVPEAGQDQVSADELLPELQLHSEAVTGRVYFAGIVVPGAEVEVRQGGESQSCITDSEGYFHAVIDPNARVTLVARSDSAYALEEAWSGWPRRLNLRPIAELADRVRVVDSDDERPIQGAMVKVWECFYPPTGNYVSAKEGATLVGEGVTGVDGVLQLLAPLPLAFYCFEANAPGYVSNFLEADVRSGAYQIGLVRGEDPILYVLDAEGRPMPTSEVLFGSPVFQVYPVDEEGKVRGRLGWNHPWQEEELRDFMVRLPSGRFWHSPQASGSSPDVQVADGKIECRIPDPEVAVELQGMALPEGAWIEAARYLKRHHWALLGYGIDDPGIIGTSDFLQKPWQSLVLGQSVNLDRGWAGQDLAVIARIQPGSQILGVFPIVDGRAVVHQVEIARLRLGVVGLPEFGAGTWLAFLRTLDQKRSMDSQYTEPVEIEHDYAEFLAPAGSYSLTLEHSTGLARYRLKKNQFLPLSVGGPSYEEKLILGAGETSLSCQVESVEWRRVQITLGGFPVPGGSLGSSKIDLAGWTALPADHNGMISISSLMQLSIPPELGLGPDTPIHVNDFFPKAIDVQLAAGAEAVLDFPLASFVIDPRGIDLSVGYSLHITSRSDYSVRSENLFPPSFTDNRSKQGWSDRKIGITQSNVNWVFRVPEGQYQVWLIEYPSREKDAKERQVVELTPPGGKFLPRDMQTVLSRQD